MQWYVNFESDSYISGFYNDDINDRIPESAIPITIEQWELYSAAAHLYRLDGGVIRQKTQAELDAEEAARPPAPKSPEQLRIEQLEGAVESLILEALGGGPIV